MFDDYMQIRKKFTYFMQTNCSLYKESCYDLNTQALCLLGSYVRANIRVNQQMRVSLYKVNGTNVFIL